MRPFTSALYEKSQGKLSEARSRSFISLYLGVAVLEACGESRLPQLWLPSDSIPDKFGGCQGSQWPEDGGEARGGTGGGDGGGEADGPARSSGARSSG